MPIENPTDHPEWMQALMRELSGTIRPLGFIGQLGFRYLAPESAQNATQRWLLGVYLVPHELSGGRHDGAAAVSGFCLDIHTLITLFSAVSTLEWRVPRRYTNGLAGPEVWLEGLYCGTQRVQLHIYAEPPSDEAPDLVLDVVTNTLRAK
jgi:hypothetical protein